MPLFKNTVSGRTVNVSGAAAEARYAKSTHWVPVEPEPDFPEGDPAESWKGAQLAAYAKAHDVDLAGATTKADMLKAIEAAAKAKTDGANPPQS